MSWAAPSPCCLSLTLAQQKRKRKMPAAPAAAAAPAKLADLKEEAAPALSSSQLSIEHSGGEGAKVLATYSQPRQQHSKRKHFGISS